MLKVFNEIGEWVELLIINFFILLGIWIFMFGVKLLKILILKNDNLDWFCVWVVLMVVVILFFFFLIFKVFLVFE